MRPIDADEVLKRWGLKFYAMGGDRLGPNGDDIHFYVNGLLNEIQNAPTVDTYTEDDVKTAIKEGHQVGYEMAKAKFERPTGEWIKNETRPNECQCSNCGNYDLSYFPFCHWCGADMRTEADNEA